MQIIRDLPSTLQISDAAIRTASGIPLSTPLIGVPVRHR